MERSRENAHSFFHARRHANTRSHLINARTLRKRQYLRSETVRTQPNLHVPSVLVVQVLWLPCHKTIYEISSSFRAVKSTKKGPANSHTPSISAQTHDMSGATRPSTP